MFFSGHDTTATGISWILYSLALNPEWQQKCQKEIDQVLEGRDTDDLEWFGKRFTTFVSDFFFFVFSSLFFMYKIIFSQSLCLNLVITEHEL